MQAEGRSPKRVSTGPTGETVRTNIAAIRRQKGQTLRELSSTMSEIGWPMSNASLSQIENGSRRVDVDDLVAIAVALDVSPNTLLMPRTHDTTQTVKAAGIASISARNYWYFLDGMLSPRTQGLDFPIASQPPFLRPAQYDWQSNRNPAELLVSREMETDGIEPSMRCGFGYESIFDEDKDE